MHRWTRKGLVVATATLTGIALIAPSAQAGPSKTVKPHVKENIITVHTQQELQDAWSDASNSFKIELIPREEIHIDHPPSHAGTTVYVYDERRRVKSPVRIRANISVSVIGHAEVYAYKSAKITAYDSAVIYARDSVKVFALDNAEVHAYNSTRVNAAGNTVTQARHSVKVTAFEKAVVYAGGTSRVTASDFTTVHAVDSAHVCAIDAAHVYATHSVSVDLPGSVARNVQVTRVDCPVTPPRENVDNNAAGTNASNNAAGEKKHNGFIDSAAETCTIL